MSSSDKKKNNAVSRGNLQRKIVDVDATARLPRDIRTEGTYTSNQGGPLSLSPGRSGSEIPENITLFFTSDKLFIRSQSRNENCIVVDRQTEQIRVESSSSARIPQGAAKKNFFGLLGQIRLFATTYLIFISRRRRVGREAQHNVWKLTGVNFVKIKEEQLNLRSAQEKMNSRVIYLLIRLLTDGEFLFAYTFDFTHTVQRLHSLIGPDNLGKPIFTRGEIRFIWNEFLAENMIDTEGLAEYLVPLVRGYFVSNKCHLNGQDFTLTLVSRVGVSRAGVRYFTRGLDLSGNIGNYVETEVIVETPKDRFSFVQTRSSPPLIWEQRPNLSKNPKPKIKAKDNNMAAFTLHFDSQCKIYGPHILLDILDRTGFEGYIADFYSHLVVRCGSNRVHYVPIPFKSMEQMLADLEEHHILDEIVKYGFVMVTGGRKIISTQKGIVRTTGFDSVDRTNSVQCLISSVVLGDMLVRAGVFRKNDGLEFYGKLKKIFYGMWADNGDSLSYTYCGSPSVTSDALRLNLYSSRLLPKIKRWYVDAVRYYMSNFCHGQIQDGLDVLTGRFIPTESVLPRNRQDNELNPDDSPTDEMVGYSGEVDNVSFLSRNVTNIVPFFIVLSIGNFVVFILQVGGEDLNNSLLCSVVWFIVSLSLLTMTIMLLGKYFADMPKFVKQRSRRLR